MIYTIESSLILLELPEKKGDPILGVAKGLTMEENIGFGFSWHAVEVGQGDL
jgi:hypothetical protein